MLVFIIAAILVVFMIAPLISAWRGKISAEGAKRRLIYNLASFAAFCIFGAANTVIALAAPEAAGAANEVAAAVSPTGYQYIGAALAMGMAAIGGGIAIGPSASAAIGSISENPKNFGRAIVFVAFGESITIFGFLIAFILSGK